MCNREPVSRRTADGPVNVSASGSSEPWVILFRSIHHVLAAEQVFQQRGIWCDLVPVPRDLNSDCGMAIHFRPRHLPAVRSLLSELHVKPHSIHRPVPTGHADVTDGVLQTDEPA